MLGIQVGFGLAKVWGSSKKDLGSLGKGRLQQPHLSRATLATEGCTRDSHCVTDQDDKRKGRKGQ